MQRPNREVFKGDPNKPDNWWYTERGIPPWEYSEANKFDPWEHAILKYLTRWRHKGTPIEDLQKIKIHADELIRQERMRQLRAKETGKSAGTSKPRPLWRRLLGL